MARDMTDQKKYDPNLRAAVREIRAVLKRYDCTGHVVLASATHSEFMFSPYATWSAVVEAPPGIRVRTTHIPDAARKKYVLDATTHMVFSTRDLLAKGFDFYDGLAKAIESIGEVTFTSLVGKAPDATPLDDDVH